MNKTEIKKILKCCIKDEWIVFNDPSDKDYFLKMTDLEEMLDQMEITEFKQGRNYYEDMREEYESL